MLYVFLYPPVFTWSIRVTCVMLNHLTACRLHEAAPQPRPMMKIE